MSKRQLHTQLKKESVREVQARASKALVNKMITLVDLHLLPEENGEILHGTPRIVLHNGTILTFKVQDYGSGTYGIVLVTEKP